jgi:hypothetical protein
MFESLTKAKKLEKAKRLFTNAVDRDVNWQKEAREDFLFRDGEQWTADERRILEEELRPALTFNLTKSSIDLIMGMNEDNRVNMKASPVEPTDGFLAEVLNDIQEWIRDNNNFEDEEDGALESAAICGRGYIAIDFVPDPKRFGEIDVTQVMVPIHEVHFDPAARRPGLDDASYICWDRWFTIEDFKLRYPKVKGKRLEDIIAQGRAYAAELGMPDSPQNIFDLPPDVYDDDSDYDKPLDLNYYDKAKEMLRVVHMEYWETFDRYYIFDPEHGDFAESPVGKPTKEMKEAYLAEFDTEMVIETMKDKRVKWMHFVGDFILYDDVSPLPFDGFSIVPMFAYTDMSQRTMNHFGLVRLMKDPQREVNKRWSQALNMLNNQVQPGVYAETDTFVDEDQAKQSMKEAGGITYVHAGALTGGKLQERTVPTFPNAPMQMEQYSQDIMKKITGINPDLLGQDRGRQEPGVVVRLRQQQGITLLKPLFRNFNNLKKGLSKRLFAIIMEYMPDEQILRILRQNERYEINKENGLILDNATGLVAELRQVRELDYNIKSEEAPGNMSKRMLELTALMEMMQAGFPVDPLQVIEKLELPASEKLRWTQYIAEQMQQQQAEADKQFQAQLGIEQEKIEVQKEKNQMEFMVDMAKINQMAAKDDKKMAMDYQRLSLDEKKALAQYMADMLNIIAQGEKDEAAIRTQYVKTDAERQKIAIKADERTQQAYFDAAKHRQDMSQSADEHRQEMRQDEEVHRQEIDQAREKGKVDLENAKKMGEVQQKNARQQQGSKTTNEKS